MAMEYKAAPAFTMGIEDRTVTGIFAVHGNVDDGHDRSAPGLFGDFTAGGRKRAVFLWQHDSATPPTATIDRLFEVVPADLPPAVKLYAPDATGAVAVTRTYLDTPRANEVLAGLKAGAITEMSYAYDPKEWSFEDDGETGPTIRNLVRAELFDVSDVNWGMNPATSADGRKGRPIAVEHAMVLAAVADYTKRYQHLSELRAKEGRVLSGETRKRIEDAVDALAMAQTTLKALLAATDPKDRPDVRALLLEMQQTFARLNGVPA